MIERYLDSLVEYAVRTGLAQEADRRVLTNRLLDILRLDDYTPSFVNTTPSTPAISTA